MSKGPQLLARDDKGVDDKAEWMTKGRVDDKGEVDD